MVSPLAVSCSKPDIKLHEPCFCLTERSPALVTLRTKPVRLRQTVTIDYSSLEGAVSHMAVKDESKTFLEDLTRYAFNDDNYLRQALDTSGEFRGTNKEISLVGDAVLRLVLLNEWWKRQTPRGYPETSLTIGRETDSLS